MTSYAALRTARDLASESVNELLDLLGPSPSPDHASPVGDRGSDPVLEVVDHLADQFMDALRMVEAVAADLLAELSPGPSLDADPGPKAAPWTDATEPSPRPDRRSP